MDKNFKITKKSRAKRRLTVTTGIGLSLSLITACAGGVGSGAADEQADAGVPPGATKEEYTQALAEMEPVTLTLQSTASSADDVAAYRATGLKESVEDLSDGKITIDIAYGPSIAEYTEVDTALADGRIDLAYMIPIYMPDQYPTFTMMAAGAGLAGSSPLAEDLAINAGMLEVAYETEGLLDEYEAQGLTPLIPFNATSSVMAYCTDPIETLEDWEASVVSLSSQAALLQTEALGATGTSLEFTETFEALQRNLVDCSLTTTLAATMSGLAEVAPHVSYSTDAGFARGAGAFVGGKGYQELPLAAQQLIFDQMGEAFKNSRRADFEGTSMLMQALTENDGAMYELDDTASEVMLEATHEIVDADMAERINESVDKWRSEVEELGYADQGDFESYPEWHDNSEDALDLYAERVFDELLAEHRPE